MDVMLILIPVTVALVAAALWGFVWSVRNEQFEDLDKQAYSILFEKGDTEVKKANTKKSAEAADSKTEDTP